MNTLEYGPWNPGIVSQLPEEVIPFITILREENVFQARAEVEELSQFTGMAWEDLVTFRPQRLAVHELLIRISADISVPDGTRYEDLGVNFRRIAKTLFEKYIQPNMQQITDCYDDLRLRAYEQVEKELDAVLYAGLPRSRETKGWKQRFHKFRAQTQSARDPIAPEIHEAQIIAKWKEDSLLDDEMPLRRSILHGLSRVCGSIMTRHGRIRGEKAFLAALVIHQVCNALGSSLIGSLIEPMIATGISKERYIRLPIQTHPVVMNVKGASASGKSTLRPLQRQLAQRLGLQWQDFALISPDIWRKYLLDYKSLGDAYKYAAVCSGHELKIVDRKLDDYMAVNAEKKAIPHMLIDRFRFDSFAEGSGEAGSNLLTRFGVKVFMFYMITPPHDTVERAWLRGLKVGRYKAVDDLLDHNVEAFSGMPKIFFTWALDRNKEIHYEFLDNSVNLGQPPRTVAFGENGVLYILDVECMMDIDRYKKIDINANSEQAVYPQGDAMAPDKNSTFLLECIKRLESVIFANPRNGSIIGRINQGKIEEWNSEELERVIQDYDTRLALKNLFPEWADKQEFPPVSMPAALDAESVLTLGDWGA